MEEQQLTEWFPGNLKPARVGVYQVRTALHYTTDPSTYSYWDGIHWNGSWNLHETAVDSKDWFNIHNSQGSCEMLQKWRGLASDPKGK